MELEKTDKPVKTVQRGKSYLMHLVAKSAKTEFQVRQKLRHTDYCNDVIDEVIEYGKEYQYIDDNAFAKLWLKSQVNQKRYGKYRCIQELKKKGIASEIIETQVNKFFEENSVSEHQIALEYIIKKRHMLKSADPYQKKQKAYRILFQRGFATDTINSVLDEYFSFDEENIANISFY